MNRQRLSRPSLKITRRVDQERAGRFTFEVWSPFTGNYEPAASIVDGLRRVGELADLILQMWLQRHPKRAALMDVPDAERSDSSQWAEFRINVATRRSYDTRRSERPGWIRATGMAQAAAATCGNVGYCAAETRSGVTSQLTNAALVACGTERTI